MNFLEENHNLKKLTKNGNHQLLLPGGKDKNFLILSYKKVTTYACFSEDRDRNTWGCTGSNPMNVETREK